MKKPKKINKEKQKNKTKKRILSTVVKYLHRKKESDSLFYIRERLEFEIEEKPSSSGKGTYFQVRI